MTGGVYFNDDNDIIGFWGLTNQPMGHKFVVDGIELAAWCAWDTFFLPGLLGKTAEVFSTCPVSEESIHLTISPDGIHQCSPDSTVLSFVTPNLSGIREDIVANFCHFILFFKSMQEAQQWTTKNPGTFVMNLHDASTLAQMKNQQKYPGLL